MRRMAETAAHLTDHVFPRLPLRQWELSVPNRVRYFMQRDGAVLGMVLRIFLRVIAQTHPARLCRSGPVRGFRDQRDAGVPAQRLIGGHQRFHRRKRPSGPGALAAVMRESAVCAGAAAQSGR